jgi:hypothetical protein
MVMLSHSNCLEQKSKSNPKSELKVSQPWASARESKRRHLPPTPWLAKIENSMFLKILASPTKKSEDAHDRNEVKSDSKDKKQ